MAIPHLISCLLQSFLFRARLVISFGLECLSLQSLSPPSPTRSESRVPFFPHSRTIIRLPFRLFPTPLVTLGQGEALEEERSLEDFWPEVAR